MNLKKPCLFDWLIQSHSPEAEKIVEYLEHTRKLLKYRKQKYPIIFQIRNHVRKGTSLQMLISKSFALFKKIEYIQHARIELKE